MLERGVYLARKGFVALSLPIGDAEVDHFVDAVADFLDVRKDLVTGHADRGLLLSPESLIERAKT